jgi:hypothetical protein
MPFCDQKAAFRKEDTLMRSGSYQTIKAIFWDKDDVLVDNERLY